MALRVPSGRTRGRKKQLRPAGARASTRNASLIGADRNHLWPVIRKRGPQWSSPSGTASLVLARTSEPPCFSVMPMPMVKALFSRQGLSAGS